MAPERGCGCDFLLIAGHLCTARRNLVQRAGDGRRGKGRVSLVTLREPQRHAGLAGVGPLCVEAILIKDERSAGWRSLNKVGQLGQESAIVCCRG